MWFYWNKFKNCATNGKSFWLKKGGVNFDCVNNNGENSFSFPHVLCGWSSFVVATAPIIANEKYKNKSKREFRRGNLKEKRVWSWNCYKLFKIFLFCFLCLVLYFIKKIERVINCTRFRLSDDYQESKFYQKWPRPEPVLRKSQTQFPLHPLLKLVTGCLLKPAFGRFSEFN